MMNEIQPSGSVISSLASLPKTQQEKIISQLSADDLERLKFSWKFHARTNQLAPEGDWLTWLILAGRGFGKTRAGAEWIRQKVCGKTPLARGEAERVALIAETAADCRDVMVEGESGLLGVHPPDFRPTYEPSKRRVTWPNGAVATLYNGTEPDQLRGPQHDTAWIDELAKYRYAQDAWDMLQFGLRLGEPQQIITTTPRPIPTLRAIIKDERTVITKGSTYDNRANLADAFLKTVVAKYEGTRLGRQELNAEILDDIPGALWTRENLDQHRKRTDEDLPDMQRIVIAVDPAASTPESAKSDSVAETGIIVAGLGIDGRGYVFDDLSCSLSPNGWGRRAVSGYDRYEGDAIVLERNQGGDMVRNTIQSVRPGISCIEVHASRGKVTRAEPISALYEQGRISHVGSFSELEDQMVLFTTDGIYGDTTADRVDALVWAFTELFPSLIHKDEGHDFTSYHPGGAGWMAG